MSGKADRLLEVRWELSKRKGEAHRLYMPMDHQLPLYRTRARRVIVRGGNQSGKTLSGADFYSRRVTGHFRFGMEEVNPKRKLLVVSLDTKLLAENQYRKMFEEGPFDVCAKCKQVKHVCLATAECGPEEGWNDRYEPAPPLIPSRLLDKSKGKEGVVWLEKARGVPDRIYLTTGAIIDFRTAKSGREAFQGVQHDDVWVDEEGGQEESVMNEIIRGLIKRNGMLMQTATPLAAGVHLLEFAEEAQEEAEDRKARADKLQVALDALPGHPFYEEHILDSDLNVSLDKVQFDKWMERLGVEEEAVRRKGGFLIQHGLVYKEFHKSTHVIEPFVIPQGWTIYVTLDPGHANAFAILFAAVAPNGRVFIFDELYLRRTEVRDVVLAWQALLAGGSRNLTGPRRAQRSAIDPNAVQQHSGMEKGHVKRQVEMIRKELNFVDVNKSPVLWKASNPIQAGILAVQSLLKVEPPPPDGNGKPRLSVMSNCTNFLREIARYRYPRPKEDKDVVENKTRGPMRKADHLMDDVRYLAMMNPIYIQPPQKDDPRLARVRNRLAARRRRRKGKLVADGYSLS